MIVEDKNKGWHFDPILSLRVKSETEISVWWDEAEEMAETIPATPEAILEWIELEHGGNEIDGGHSMTCEPSVLSGTGHHDLCRMVEKVIGDYNRPHTVAHWIEAHGSECAARLEEKYFGV